MRRSLVLLAQMCLLLLLESSLVHGGVVMISELEKMSLYKAYTNGVPLPDFAFFKQEDRDRYSMDLLKRTVVVDEKEYVFVRSYDYKRAQSLALSLKENVQGVTKDQPQKLQTVYEDDMVNDFHLPATDKLQQRLSTLKRELNQVHRELAALKAASALARRSPGERFMSYLDELTRKEVSQILTCLPRGSPTPNGDLRFCGVCVQQTTLDTNRFPRFLNEITCDPVSPDCLLGEGCCRQKIMYTTFMVMDNTGNWSTYTQAIRTGCECELHLGSVFVPFL